MDTTHEDAASAVAAVEPAVRRYCRSRIGYYAGDDAAQRVLLALWRQLRDGREFDNLAAYAMYLAKWQTFRDYAHPQHGGRDLLRFADQEDWSPMYADPTPGPEEAVMHAEQVATATEEAGHLLAQLTPRSVDILRATVMAERSNARAAARLGIQENTVKCMRRRAMARLRQAAAVPPPVAPRRRGKTGQAAA